MPKTGSSDVEAALLTRQTNGTLFAVETEWRGTNTAALGDPPATGRRFALRMVSVGTIDDQRLVTEHRDYWDLASFLAQVGGGACLQMIAQEAYAVSGASTGLRRVGSQSTFPSEMRVLTGQSRLELDGKCCRA